MMDQKSSNLAIEGGPPVCGKGNPLPQLYPRDVPEKAYEYVKEVLDSGWSYDRYGGFITLFEQALAEFCGVKHAVAVHNCTAALHAAEAALDCEHGDEIIVSAISDFGSAEGILSERLVPVFADVDERTGVTTGEDVEKVVTGRTRGIVVVHFYGQVCDMDPILEVANRHHLPVFEDVAQSPFVSYKGRMAGTVGLCAAFSFAPEKTMSADGLGAFITDDEAFAHKVRLYSQFRGVSKEIAGFGRVHTRLGINFRADQLRSALALAQLEVIQARLDKRVALGEELTERLSQIEGMTPCRAPNKEQGHGYWMYAFQVDPERSVVPIDTFADALKAEGLECGTARYYLLPDAMAMLHRDSPEYAKLVKTNPRLAEREYSGDMVPKAKRHLNRTIRWKWTDKYTEQNIADIVRILEKVARGYLR